MDAIDINDIPQEMIPKLTVVKLKTILKTHTELISGNKEMLVARCLALKSKIDHSTATVSLHVDDNNNQTIQDPFIDFELCREITYDILNGSARNVWTDDLRTLIECNFYQLFEYLVTRTQKLEESVMKGSTYKKLKSYLYFVEGHVSNVEVSRGKDYVWVRAKVTASMKKLKYKVLIVFNLAGDVKYAACECPAGLGVEGCGKCNHVGGLLFSINSFTAHGLQTNPEKISCTSKINGWIVPRNLNVTPKAISDITISQQKLSGIVRQHNENSLYDPRAPVHRNTNVYELNSLYQNLSECAPSSGFFMFHKEPEQSESEPVLFEDDFESLDISSNVDVITQEEIYVPVCDDLNVQDNSNVRSKMESYIIKENHTIKDNEPIDDNFIDTYVTHVIENEHIDKNTIKLVEEHTKQQSCSDLWKYIHDYKMTSSNFGKIVKCKINPQSIIKSMLYDNPFSKYLEYGKEHEKDAIVAYENYKKMENEPIHVEKVGIILSEERPGYGTSMDGIFTTNGVKGGIECKCPLSKKNKTIQEACSDPSFYLQCDENGIVKLKSDHQYFIQIQGQLFISKVEFVDFVVWFGENYEIHVERIYFDEQKWKSYYLPLLDFFYKWAFIPELQTRRVKRGIKLHDQWQSMRIEYLQYLESK